MVSWKGRGISRAAIIICSVIRNNGINIVIHSEVCVRVCEARLSLGLEPATTMPLCPVGSQRSTLGHNGDSGKCVLVRHSLSRPRFPRERESVCVSVLMCVNLCVFSVADSPKRHQMAPNPEAPNCFAQQCVSSPPRSPLLFPYRWSFISCFNVLSACICWLYILSSDVNMCHCCPETGLT